MPNDHVLQLKTLLIDQSLQLRFTENVKMKWGMQRMKAFFRPGQIDCISAGSTNNQNSAWFQILIHSRKECARIRIMFNHILRDHEIIRLIQHGLVVVMNGVWIISKDIAIILFFQQINQDAGAATVIQYP